MNRDEFLTKLAMELAEWPDYLGDRHWTEVLGGYCEVRISRNEWLAERARLINKPGWMIAPEWARYRAQGECGEWQFFDDTPRMGEYLSFGNASRVYTAIHGRIPAGHDWRTTLESRPVDVTPEEDEAWSAFDESRIDRIAQSDGSGDHYGVSDGRKFDTNKPMMGLIPPLAEEALARVLTFGAKKYAPDNWRKVEDKERRYMDAMLRHLNAHRRGEKADPETGESHLAHAACCVMFMLELEEEVK